jgi:hypothetical protein
MTAAASAVYSANSDILIYFSGLDSDFNIEPAVGGSTLLDPGFSFDITSYEWAHRLVFEMHEYDEGISDSCPIYETILESFGADATTKTGTGSNRAPLVISEWGHDETDASDAWQSAYSECLTQFMVERQLGWMMWVLAGSYYIRSGVQDYDETYGKFYFANLKSVYAWLLMLSRSFGSYVERLQRCQLFCCNQATDSGNLCCLWSIGLQFPSIATTVYTQSLLSALTFFSA